METHALGNSDQFLGDEIWASFFLHICNWTNLLMNTRGSAASKEIFVCVEIVPGVNTVCLSEIVNETKDI